MTARRKARKKALDLLFEADLRSADAVELLKMRPADELSESLYVATLVNGVWEHVAKIDELIHTYAQDWDIDRMPAIDRNLLRIALFEILWLPDLDDRIAINEAVEIAQDLSTSESAGFINGVLGRIAALKSVISL
jgi:N utilization substance protein B